MPDHSTSTIASQADETRVQDEIAALVGSERAKLRNQSASFAPRSSGRRFPLLLNAGAVVLLGLVALGFWLSFTAARDSYILKAASQASLGTDIISALLAEAQDALDRKNQEIAVIEQELADIETRLAALGMEQLAERQPLIDRRTVLQGDLAVKLRERDSLLAQVKYQSNSLAQARSAGGDSSNPLQELADREQLRRLFEESFRQGSQQINSLVSSQNWEGALAQLQQLKTMSQSDSGSPSEADRLAAQSRATLIASMEAMVLAARDGNPKPVAPPADSSAAPGLQDYQARIAGQEQEIRELKAAGAALQKANQEATERLEALNRRLAELSAVRVANVQPAGSGSQLEAAVAAWEHSAASLNPELAKGVTPENLPQRLSQTLEGYATAAADYRQTIQTISRTAMSENREVLRGNLKSLLGVLKDNPATAALLPDMAVHLNALLENLIQVEVARVKAQAEDELLAVMLSASGKLADEQVRMLASANNSRTDSAVVLNSLIKEIDKVAETTLKERTGKSLPRALGTVISVAKPNVTVRKAALFETFRVKRVYLSRILPNGDRIPIADADITASTGDDVILKITSTIAPTIYPEKNDLVFVEF